MGPENGNNDTDEQSVNVHTAPPSTQEPTEDIPRGAWMQVQPRRRPRKQEKSSDQRGNDARNGSRFSVLHSEEGNDAAGNATTEVTKFGQDSTSIIFGSPENSNSLGHNSTKKWTPKKKNQVGTPRQPLGHISNILKSSVGSTFLDRAANCSKQPLVNNPTSVIQQKPSFSLCEQASLASVNHGTVAKEGYMRPVELVVSHHNKDTLIAGHKPPDINMVLDQQKENLPCSSVPFAYANSREELMKDHESTLMEDGASDPILDRSSDMETNILV